MPGPVSATVRTAPAPSVAVARAQRQGKPALPAHRLCGIGDQIDDYLLHLARIHKHIGRIPQIGCHRDLSFAQHMIHKHQAILDQGSQRNTSGISGKIPRSRKLQKFANDRLDARYLPVDQIQLGLDLTCPCAQRFPNNVHIALDHCDGIVDFMGNARRDLPD